MEAAHLFLQRLAGQALDDSESMLTVWTLQGKKSMHFRDWTAAADYVGTVAGKSDTYYGTALRSPGLNSGKRGGLNDCDSLLCLWADVDCAIDGVHADCNLPPTKEDARSIVDGMGRAASYIIDSGNGLQAVWFLDEPIDLTDEQTMRDAGLMTQRWEATSVAVARKLGWSYDCGNHNLDRVLRMPGTKNFKGGGDGKPVVILYESDQQWSLDDLAAVMVDPGQGAPISGDVRYDDQRKIVEERGGSFVLNRDAEPPAKLVGMLDVDPQFQASWQMNRKFKSGDDSCSAYCMSLTTIGVHAGWSNQEVADLICAFHRRWKEHRDNHFDPLRHQYRWFVLMIYKARKSRPLTEDAKLPPQREEEIASDAEVVEVEVAKHSDFGDRARWIRDQLGIPFVQIEQDGRFENMPGDVTYVIVLERDGTEERIPIGGLDVLNQRRKLRGMIEAATSHKVQLRVEHYNNARWEKSIVPVLARCVVLVSHGSPQEIIHGWLSEYLSGHAVTNDADALMQARTSRRPYVDGGSLFVATTHFGAYVRDVLSHRDASPRRIQAMLRNAGFTRITVRTERGSRSYYCAPLDAESVPRITVNMVPEPPL